MTVCECKEMPRRDEPRQYVFLEYNEQELRATPHFKPKLRPGDLLAEVAGQKRHLGADEIVVVRLEDDVVDSVWPEEVRRIAGPPLFLSSGGGHPRESLPVRAGTRYRVL